MFKESNGADQEDKLGKDDQKVIIDKKKYELAWNLYSELRKEILGFQQFVPKP